MKPETLQSLRHMRNHLRAGWLGQREVWVNALDEVLAASRRSRRKSKRNVKRRR